MIRIMAMDGTGELHFPDQINDLLQQTWNWYWVDFSKPTPEEAKKLERFSFHPLAVKDCFYYFQKPKLDYYDQYQFLVLNAFDVDYQVHEVDLFFSHRFVVTYHFEQHNEIDTVWERIANHNIGGLRERGPAGITYKIIDKLVDSYFPTVQNIEHQLVQYENDLFDHPDASNRFVRDIFKMRKHLLDLRLAILPMRDLLYRIVNSRHIHLGNEKYYYLHIHEHLEKLSQSIESSTNMASDIRDHYMSVNSHRLNKHMMILTIITVIFMPLTFIAGIYGMNFKFMPELEWRYGYFVVIGVMVTIAILLTINYRGFFTKDDI
ncbi:magnesium transporter [Seinonella peptonophila]|uniref:Magnesium transport protein CorA n=1 Tax=Seinonella peptonophila TaxID=112248 RepID=A0A1M4ZYC0_9BACL|nr:magnesium/cobalt transporter CorA [Seinonella peptonophila]SHF22985.1 magnesium transporter [Seinonella peptonophila]